MSKRAPWVLIAAATLAGAACGPADENRATQTTTEEGTSTAPGSEQAAASDRALVRVMNAIPGSQPADVMAGDQRAFTNVDYKTVTPYKEIPQDASSLKLMASGQDQAMPMAEKSEGLTAGDRYTVVAMPGEAGAAAELIVLNDDVTPPSEGKAKVRIIHASRDVGEVSVALSGREDALFDGVNAAGTSGYKEVEPSQGSLEVRAEDKKAVLARVPDASFQPGKLYTVLVVGRTDGTSKVEAVTFEDQLIPAPSMEDPQHEPMSPEDPANPNPPRP